MTVTPLSWNERYYLPQETGNYSVAGFKLFLERKMTHYLITYYLPSGLFVVVSWASFLIPSDDIQVSFSTICDCVSFRYASFLALLELSLHTKQDMVHIFKHDGHTKSVTFWLASRFFGAKIQRFQQALCFQLASEQSFEPQRREICS